jgi:hypothetical protein
MFTRRRLEIVTEDRCFLLGSCRDVISSTVNESQLSVDSSRNELIVSQSLAGKNVSTEAEDIVGIRHQVTTSED